MIPLGVLLHLFGILAGVVGQDLVQAFFQLQEMLHVDLHIRDLTLGPGRGLVDHNLRIGQGDALSPCTGGQQERAHAGSHADADGGHVALDILHGIVDGHTRGNGTAGAVDVHLDILVGVLGLQIQQLGHHQAGGGIIDLFAQEDDAVVQQPGKDVIRTLTPVGLLHNIRD